MMKTGSKKLVDITLIGLITALLLGTMSGKAIAAQDNKAAAIRTIEATRAESAPVLDGKLDDACWQKANAVTGFLAMDSDRLATYQSFGYVCYDDSHLYIAMKCLIPRGVKPAGKLRPHDIYLFSDDIVELMVDPGCTRKNYYQLVVNAYGSTFDSARTAGGSQHDPSWNGDWKSAAYIDSDFWSMEASIPFYTLGVSPGMGSTWGINLCRETKKPADEYSSIAARGTFANATSFAVVKGINADFNKYYYQISSGQVSLDSSYGKTVGLFSLPVTNMSGKERKVKIEWWRSSSNGEDAVKSEVTVLRPGETYTPPGESLEIEPLSQGKTDAYIVQSPPKTGKIVVSDADSGEILALSLVKRPWFFEPLKIQVDDPWRRDMRPGKSSSVSVRVSSLVNPETLRNGELVVKLTSRETRKTLASKTIRRPSETAKVVFPTADLPWGAYDVEATLKDPSGREIVSSLTLATVLPGGEHQIKVLNNMVSELMNAGERGLLGEKRIQFMNPRNGWVFFSVAGKGSILLASEGKPIAEASSGKEAIEGMRMLPAGRHTLIVEGAPKRIVVHAVPELMYSCDPPAGMDWESLGKEVLLNCNAILGSTSNPEIMKAWTAQGKKWVGFSVAPSHDLGGDDFVPAEDYYNRLASDEGFVNPYMSGVMADQIGSSSLKQKVAIAGAISKLTSNPKFRDRSFSPWYEGMVFGSDADLAFMKVVLDSGWPYSFYLYLIEQSSEKDAREYIRNTLIRNIRACETGIPGSARRALVTLGYMCHPPTGQFQNIDPAIDFKVLMQMQFDALANDPAFFGVYGALWYYSPYVDEENARWAGRLFRHYGIEGKTSKLTSDPYRLTHIKNPEFEEGTSGWSISEAEPGSVRTDRIANYGNLQGRYLGGGHGDTFLLTKRSEKAPNAFSQEIKGLKPGRVYSLKLITADYDNIIGEISSEQKEVVSIKFDNAELVNIAGKNSQETYPNHYGHPLGKFTGNHNAYLNFHWYVFRATGKTARVTISDWAGADNSGGPIGQQIMYNFIEVQPYFDGG